MRTLVFVSLRPSVSLVYLLLNSSTDSLFIFLVNYKTFLKIRPNASAIVVKTKIDRYAETSEILLSLFIRIYIVF